MGIDPGWGYCMGGSHVARVLIRLQNNDVLAGYGLAGLRRNRRRVGDGLTRAGGGPGNSDQDAKKSRSPHERSQHAPSPIQESAVMLGTGVGFGCSTDLLFGLVYG